MKKTILTLIALVTFANADYEIFKSQTEEIGTPIKSTEIFFGEYSDFSKKLSDEAKDSTKGAFIESLFGVINGGVTGLGIGAIVGVLDPWIMSSELDQRFLRVTKNEDKNGNISYTKEMFLGARNGDKEYTLEDVSTILNEEKPFYKG